MTPKDIKDLLKLINSLELAEVKLEQEDFKISVRTKQYSKQVVATEPSQVIMAQPTAPAATSLPAAATTAAPSPPDEPAPTAESNLVEVKSPMVGTFYRSSSPDKPVYVKVGDTIEKGDTVCIVEAMKLFNEIESEVSGKIVKVVTEDAAPVEYDQVLFLVDPQG